MTYLRLEGITKQFGSFVANQEINLSIERGSIHALLGENGAGKTTLMNILCGLYQPDAGQIFIEDKPVKITSANTAIHQGIGMIHQHFMLIPQLTVTENIILGTKHQWRLNLQQKAKEVAQLSQTYQLEIDPLVKVEILPIGMQQRVEILKALYRQAKILILDEPTAVLTPSEVENLIQILRNLAVNDHTIIFISHKLEEVMKLCDRITILRRGEVVTTKETKDTNRQELAELMVGRSVLLQLNKPPATPQEVIVKVQNLQVFDARKFSKVQNLSFQLHAGEILGIAGVDGNGQRELADTLAGLVKSFTGTIELLNQPLEQQIFQSRKKQIKLIGYIPEDRQKMGLIMGFNLAKNLILKSFKFLPYCRQYLLKYKIINNHAQTAIADFDIRAESPKIKVSQMSGGNQQKVVLARELAGNPALIIAMQPTRGLDVGATEYVQQRLLEERRRGAAILYISTELEEVMAISDRIAVMYEGTFVDILDANTATVEQIGYLMAGGSQKNEA